MSHFSVLVLVPENVKDIEKYVKQVLAPYDENKKVAKYEEQCHCVGELAKKGIQARASEKFGSWDDLRKTFHEKNAKLSKQVQDLEMKCYEKGLSKEEKKTIGKEHQKADKRLSKLWKDFTSPRSEFERTEFEKHPERKKPNPGCGFYSEDFIKSLRKDHPDEKKYLKLKPGDRYEDKSGCGGTGKYLTTYNPKSKWDWHVIGGRWTGALVPEYDPEADPENIETCSICGGTGLRTDDLGIKERKRDPEYTCNGCQGEGKHAKWPTQWKKFRGDILPTLLVPKEFSPFAIITPDGQWHEHGKMGWWAIVSDEDDGWEEKAKSIINDFRKTTTAVIVDCHI